ncbi:MAG: HIT domain-containing protein [Deltaproteobacteria bacterium]|nr:HIT domain-containing protein [Deltaproteobacteria bacterium]
MEKPLWAPWRMEYIATPAATTCIFCQFMAAPSDKDRENLVVHRSNLSFTVLNRFPYNSGHVMVIPQAHGADFATLTDEIFADLHQELKLAAKVIHEVYHPEGCNIGMNLGRIAGAGIADHLHYHIVPRWGGDTNYMPVLADTKVLIEHLDNSWQRIQAGFLALG